MPPIVTVTKDSEPAITLICGGAPCCVSASTLAVVALGVGHVHQVQAKRICNQMRIIPGGAERRPRGPGCARPDPGPAAIELPRAT